jgi:chromosomal replication initiator protein
MNESATPAYVFSPEEVEALREQMCAQLELELSPAAYNTWVLNNPLVGFEVLDDSHAKATFSCPTAFHVNNINRLLGKELKEKIDSLSGKECQLVFSIGLPVVGNVPKPVKTTVPGPVHPPTLPQSAVLVAKPVPTFPPAEPARTPQSSMSIPRIGPQMSPRVEDLFSAATLSSAGMDRAVVAARQANLRPDYNFETFAVSTTNEMAHAAATAVSNKPGSSYNPLFLYGGVGVGKTHLMHAIGNNILKNDPNVKILYCTGEEFTNEIVSAIQNKRAIKFKEKYRTAQVMLIDDVQFIAGKNAVQEEFFHTFNALIQQARQIVMTSDRPPHEINLLEDRLRSRFEAGLMIDIQQPSFELRTAILLIKSQALNLHIPMDLAQLIASKVDSARKIEGIITLIRSAVELQHRTIDLSLVEELLDGEAVNQTAGLRVSPADVVKTVANHYRLKQSAIKGLLRHQQVVQARHVAMYLLRQDLEMPLTEIGRWFSNRDHTSALHAVRKIESSLKTNDLLQRDISALRMSLTAISK